MKKSIVFTGTIALALLTAPSVLANESDTVVTKEDTNITVQNPSVEVTTSNDTIYADVDVKVNDIQIPDEITINKGDSITVGLPQELKLVNNYTFPVNNNEGTEVGTATANKDNNEVTTVFNDYFESHPLNKTFSLDIQTQWNVEKVKENQQVALDFNGRKVETTTGKAGVIGKDETLMKWGGEDAEHPGEIVWAMRVNYAKKDLVNVKVADTWDENQEYVKDSFKMVGVESNNPWKEKESEATKIAPVFHTNGFTWSADKLSDQLYISYRTKVIKQAERYLNSVVLGADNFNSQYRDVPYQFVSGKGKADGENKPEPTFEIPKESPKVEIPEFQGGIPGIPEVREKPEYTEPIGTVPNEAPVLDKPYLPIEDTPLMPPAPILEKPEYPIPAEPEKPNTPPTTPEDKPKTPAPNQYVPIRKYEEKKPVVNNIPPKVIEAAKKVETHSLPNTGSSLELALVTTGVFLATVGIAISRKETK
jgi:lpxtg cell wall surface protein, collagen binding domain protein